MLKFIHITDTHLVEQGRTLYGLDPLARLERCIDSVIEEHGDAALCVVTGDLTDAGHPNAYGRLVEQFRRLPMPVLPILGNHDDRPTFRDFFPDVATDSNGFVQYEATVGEYRGLFLDTHEPGVSHGTFCERRARWLSERLDEDERPVMLFMHHPPFKLGIPSMDRIGLPDSSHFIQAIELHVPRIVHLFFGHLHRPGFGSWEGIPFSTLRGTNHQVSLDMRTTAPVIGCHEPPQYGVVLLEKGTVTVHLHDYLDRSERLRLGS